MWFLHICFHRCWWKGAELRPDVPRMQSFMFLGGTKRVRDLWFGEGKWKAFCRYVWHIGINKNMNCQGVWQFGVCSRHRILSFLSFDHIRPSFLRHTQMLWSTKRQLCWELLWSHEHLQRRQSRNPEKSLTCRWVDRFFPCFLMFSLALTPKLLIVFSFSISSFSVLANAFWQVAALFQAGYAPQECGMDFE